MLKPVKLPAQRDEPEYGSDSPIVTCENPDCGKSGPSHLMINLMICVGSPGHPHLPPFQCPGSGQIESRAEHWACCPACWLVVGRACLEEHGHELLQQLHAAVGEASHVDAN